MRMSLFLDYVHLDVTITTDDFLRVHSELYFSLIASFHCREARFDVLFPSYMYPWASSYPFDAKPLLTSPSVVVSPCQRDVVPDYINYECPLSQRWQ